MNKSPMIFEYHITPSSDEEAANLARIFIDGTGEDALIRCARGISSTSIEHNMGILQQYAGYTYQGVSELLSVLASQQQLINDLTQQIALLSSKLENNGIASTPYIKPSEPVVQPEPVIQEPIKAEKPAGRTSSKPRPKSSILGKGRLKRG